MAKIEKNKLIEKVKELEGLSNDEKAALIGFIKTKTYGLVWEDSTEKVWEQLKDYIPVLTEDKSKAIINDTDEQKNPNHILIEGDNLLALTSLCFTHEGKVDVIYIDPPYNTGKEFVYNDNYIKKEDAFRHSTWLTFMKLRLKMAKVLLSNEGTLYISIDDNEMCNLKLLCDEVFGESNFLAIFPRVTKKGGKSTGTFAKNHDYVLGYCKNIDVVDIAGIEHTDSGFSHQDEFFEKRGPYKLNQTLDYNTLQYSKTMDFPIELDGNTYIPGGDMELHHQRHAGIHGKHDWVWRWSMEKFKFGLSNGWIVISRTGRIYTKTYLKATIDDVPGGGYKISYTDRTKPISTVDFIENTYSNDNSNKEITNMLGANVFDYVKPTALVSRLLQTNRHHNITVLDFFAGSGTTLHATMMLNSEDGGCRKCILVTNNENNICEDVTYKRCKYAIEGYTKTSNGEVVEGLSNNSLRYYKVGFVPRQKDTAYIERFARRSVNLLCIKEDVYKEQTRFGNLEADGFRYFKDGDKQFLVILEPDMIEPIIEELTKMDYKGKMPVYVFTTGHYPYTEDFWQVSEKVDLYPYPTCVYGACEKVMPKMEDKLLDLPDDVELSDEEANMTFEDLNKE